MSRWWVVSCLLLAATAALALGPQSGEPVDLLVTGGTVVTMDAERRVIEAGAVAIRGERIVAVGPASELERKYRPRRLLRAEGRLILPGLVNTHTHAAMALYRGVADDVVLETWLRDYIFPLEAKLTTAEFVYWGTKLAAWEMILGGTTTFVDMYYFEDEVARAASEAGLRVVAGETILDFPSPDFPTPADGLDYTEEFIQRWRNHPLVTPAVAPHSAYTCSADTLQAATALAKRTGAPLLIHLAESKGEMETVKGRTGRTSARYLAELGVFDVPTLAAHCIYLDAADRTLLAEKHVGCAHNPSSNIKLASGIAPVLALRAAGVKVGLGTDGPAGSNNDFDMMEEMDLAAKLQKVFSGDPQALPAIDALAMATIEGAQAAGLGEEIGSLEPGKRADVILLRRDAPHAIPAFDVYSQIVYSLKASDVEASIINGRVVMEQRRVLTLDEGEIRKHAERTAAAVRETLKHKP
ncbi:MAG TPA: amidohydrolase [Candidatus Acidoferrales bacterium]|nr:amidohydrolase [Candidatus Acidoferrales bacterium]